jgi:hypothetical protein
MPLTTSPHTEYCRSSHGASSKQMKNWLLALLGLAVRAAETVPRLCDELLDAPHMSRRDIGPQRDGNRTGLEFKDQGIFGIVCH